MHRLVTALTGLLLCTGMALPARAAEPASTRMGSWSLNSWTPGERVRLTLSYREGTNHWEWSSHQPIADLEGLTSGNMRAVRTSVAFTLTRDAGTFTFDGTLTLGVGSGKFRFVPDPTYAAKLSALGYKGVDGDAMSIMMLAVRDVSLDFAREVRNARVEDVEVSDLVRFLDHGVELDFLRALTAAGYTHLTGDDVVNFHDHGIDGAYLRALKVSGAADWSPADIISLHDHGVGTDYVARVQSAGFEDLAAEDIIRLHDHGVESGDVVRLRSALGRDTTVEDVIRLHDHGIGHDYVARIHTAGYRDLTVDQIIKLHDHGVD